MVNLLSLIGSVHRGYNRGLAAHKPRRAGRVPHIGAVTPAGPRPAARGHHQRRSPAHDGDGEEEPLGYPSATTHHLHITNSEFQPGLASTTGDRSGANP